MGADLGNGNVIGQNIECYFHKWRFGPTGDLIKIDCLESHDEFSSKCKITSYPVEEKYGFIWVFAGQDPDHSVPFPPLLENEEIVSKHVRTGKLFAHHHIMMLNSIDLQHFSTVHNIDVDFKFNIKEDSSGVFDWTLIGEIPNKGIKGPVIRRIFGNRVNYYVRIAGGAIQTNTFQITNTLPGKKIKFPPIHLLWGGVPQKSGVSTVEIFFIFKKREGPIGKLKNFLLFFLTLGVLTILKDEDIEAFPNMRFHPNVLIPKDDCVAKLIQKLNGQKVSPWSNEEINNVRT